MGNPFRQSRQRGWQNYKPRGSVAMALFNIYWAQMDAREDRVAARYIKERTLRRLARLYD
jgi:hypothetical protein